MQKFEFELSIGDTLHLGDRILTVIDVDHDEITVRVDRVDATAAETAGEPAAAINRRPPR